jgi:outer membrane protein assembly factor BamB
MFAHDEARSGTQPSSPFTSGNVQSLTLNWSFYDGTEFVSSPVVSNGIVYVVDHNGEMTALSATNGSILWQVQLGLWVEQTPAVLDGTLYIGNHDIPSDLYAISPLTGDTLWMATVPGGLKGAPITANGILYEGLTLGDPGFCTPDGIYSFNESTGAQLASWLTEGAGVSDGGAVWSPLTFDGTSIYYGTGNTCVNTPPDANAFASLTAATLSPRWAVQTASAHSDDDDGAGVVLYDNNGVTAGKNGTLYVFNAASGSVLLRKQLGSPDGYGPVSTPTVVQNTVVVSNGLFSVPNGNGVAADGGGLSAYTMQGTRLWLNKTSTEVRSVVATNDVIFVEMDNSINAIRPSNGTTLWSAPTAGDFSASPAVTSQGIFVADLSGRVYAYTLKSMISMQASAVVSRSRVPVAVRGSTAYVQRRYCLRPKHS